MRALRSLGAALALVAIVALVVRSGLFADTSVTGLRAGIESYGTLAPFALMGLVFAGAFVPSPLLLLTAVGGAIFGAVAAFTYVWAAGVVATVVPFALMRQAAGGWMERPAAARFRGLHAFDRRLRERGFATVLALRVVLCMAPPLSWGLGATRVRWRDYVGGTALGIVPGIAVGAWLGEAVTGAGSWTGLLTPGVVAPAALAIAGIVAAAVVARRTFGG